MKLDFLPFEKVLMSLKEAIEKFQENDISQEFKSSIENDLIKLV
jgi:hypothetical protein